MFQLFFFLLLLGGFSVAMANFSPLSVIGFLLVIFGIVMVVLFFVYIIKFLLVEKVNKEHQKVLNELRNQEV